MKTSIKAGVTQFVTTSARTIEAVLVDAHGIPSLIHSNNNMLLMSNKEIARKMYDFLWNEASNGADSMSKTPFTVEFHCNGHRVLISNMFGKIAILHRTAKGFSRFTEGYYGLMNTLETILTDHPDVICEDDKITRHDEDKFENKVTTIGVVTEAKAG